jgi:hypothetical protein
MADIEFVEPPGSGRATRYRHREIAEALKAKPGVWARVLTDVSRIYTTRIGQAHAHEYRPAGSFEATARRNGDRFDIYARYVGENGEHR